MRERKKEPEQISASVSQGVSQGVRELELKICSSSRGGAKKTRCDGNTDTQMDGYTNGKQPSLCKDLVGEGIPYYHCF